MEKAERQRTRDRLFYLANVGKFGEHAHFEYTVRCGTASVEVETALDQLCITGEAQDGPVSVFVPLAAMPQLRRAIDMAEEFAINQAKVMEIERRMPAKVRRIGSSIARDHMQKIRGVLGMPPLQEVF